MFAVGGSLTGTTVTEGAEVPNETLAVALAAPLLSVMLVISKLRRPALGLSILVFWYDRDAKSELTRLAVREVLGDKVTVAVPETSETL